MMSPEAFGRTHKRHVTDIVRVALERKGVIGFIDVHDGMTLLEARSLIWENVEDAPAEFQFVLDDGAPEDEKVFFESILLKGGVFKKYGQWGNPHRRFVWCSKDFDAIYWRPLNKKSNLTKDGITVTSMISVLPGNSARTRYAFMKHLSDDKALSRCFSVVAEDRRLDLEADSEATRELWTSAFVFLMRENRSRSVRKS
ncbi:uncharacterized protein IUM83_11547 [Phytophthora cinnamomi]|uniref:uncharacterized protein n=1 Tax=Phytophthora cinnamomi TaxID=4785 RepID=UPI003559F495|nr:hypothetical protein IUM83_11547 [Phytophthora cinnamomi]